MPHALVRRSNLEKRTGAGNTSTESGDPATAKSTGGKGPSSPPSDDDLHRVNVRVVAPEPTETPLEGPTNVAPATPLTSRGPGGEPMVLLKGLAEGVEWRVGVFLADGALVPVLEFSRAVPHDHPAVLQAYVGLSRCVLQVLAHAWNAKEMCPSCHLPTPNVSECDCCDRRMCQICRTRHARGHGIPGSGEPTEHLPTGPTPPRPGPKDGLGPLPGYA